MRWLYLIHTLLLFAENCAAISLMARFMKITNLLFTQTPKQHVSGISAINCAGKCDVDGGCLAFNYNRGTRTCRLMSVDPFDQTAWPGFEHNEEWVAYVERIPPGKPLKLLQYVLNVAITLCVPRQHI